MRINPGYGPEEDKRPYIEFGKITASSLHEAIDALPDESRDQIQEIAMNLATTLYSREAQIGDAAKSVIPKEILAELDFDKETASRIAMVELLAFQQWQLSNISRTISLLIEQNQD